MTGSAGVRGGGGEGAHAHQSWKVGTFVEFYLRRHLLCVKCACAGEPDPKSHPAPVQSTRCDSKLFLYCGAEGSASPGRRARALSQ